jgi:hypothetical protein
MTSNHPSCRDGDEGPRLDPAVNLPRDEHVVLVPEILADLEAERSQGDIDAAARERQLDPAGRIAELPATDLKRIQMFITPAEGDLQRSVEFGQRCLFGKPNPARYRRRYTTQSRAQLQCANLLPVSHPPNLALAVDDFKTARPAPRMDRTLQCAVRFHRRPV